MGTATSGQPSTATLSVLHTRQQCDCHCYRSSAHPNGLLLRRRRSLVFLWHNRFSPCFQRCVLQVFVSFFVAAFTCTAGRGKVPHTFTDATPKLPSVVFKRIQLGIEPVLEVIVGVDLLDRFEARLLFQLDASIILAFLMQAAFELGNLEQLFSHKSKRTPSETCENQSNQLAKG